MDGVVDGGRLTEVVMGELTGPKCVHVCVDMQRMFAEPTEWRAPWLLGVLPAVEALVDQQPVRTVHPFHPAANR